MVKTLKEKKWRRGAVNVRCAYCKEVFAQETPWQEYCCHSHRVMASKERGHANDHAKGE